MAKFDVSKKAGALFYLLERENTLSVKELEQKSNNMEGNVYLALGWLIRDNRVVFYTKDGDLHVRVNKLPATEIHY